MNAPNILLVVSDQERQRGWIPRECSLPGRQRLLDSGLEFTSVLHPHLPLLAGAGHLVHRPVPPIYDLAEDPGELVNLAHDRSRRREVREWFGRLREAERTEMAPAAG